MLRTLQQLPAWVQVALYFVILALCTILAGSVPALNDLSFFVTVSVLIATVFLGSLRKATMGCGFFPQRKKHLLQFAAGWGAGMTMLLITAILTFVLTGNGWQLNPGFSPLILLLTFVFCLWSAFAQEAVFRGFPFQAMLQRYAPWVAQLVIAIPFGLMHIKSGMTAQDIFITMLCTGLGSLLFGLAYIKTRNLALPIGIHGGWNFAQALIPRTQPGNTPDSLIIVSGSTADYTFVNVICPYLLVISLAILLLLRYRPNTLSANEIVPFI